MNPPLNTIDLDWEKRARSDVEFAIEWAKAVDEDNAKIESQLSATQALLSEAVEVMEPFLEDWPEPEEPRSAAYPDDSRMDLDIEIGDLRAARALSDKIKKHLEVK